MTDYNKMRIICSMEGNDCERCLLKGSCSPYDKEELEKAFKNAEAQKRERDELWIFIEYNGEWLYNDVVKSSDREGLLRCLQRYAIDYNFPIKVI